MLLEKPTNRDPPSLDILKYRTILNKEDILEKKKVG